MEGSSSRGVRSTRRKRRTTTEEVIEEEIVFDDPPENYGRMNFMAGKRLIPSHLKNTSILDLFEFQEVISFMRFKENIHSVECAIFYKNLRENNGVLESRVHGKDIVLTPHVIADLYGIRNAGIAVWFDPSKWPKEYNFDECLQYVLADSPCQSIALPVLPKKDMLSGKNQVLFWFLENNLLARDRKDGKLNYMVAFIMWKILSGEKINLPFYILRHMFDMRNNASVPYCMHLTKVFDRFGVPRVSNGIREPSHNWEGTLMALKTAGMYLVDNDFLGSIDLNEFDQERRSKIIKEIERLNKKRKKYEDVSSDEEEEEEMEPPAVEARVRYPNNLEILRAIQDLQENQNARFTAMEASQAAQYAAINERLSGFDHRLDYLSQRMDAMSFPPPGGDHRDDDMP